MRWTEEQRTAIEGNERLLTVVAGAGSGKTGVLTERFVHLVANCGVPPERILTITFTRAATAEMKTRIIRKLEQRGLHDARTRIESAYIHTVHALCRRLLQENPFEAGIDPEPRVLPAPAANQLRREAFHHALAALLHQQRDLETDPLIDLIADYLNLDRVRGDLLQSLQNLVQRVADAARHQGYTADDLEQWCQNYPRAEQLAARYALLSLSAMHPDALDESAAAITTMEGLRPFIVRLTETNPNAGSALSNLIGAINPGLEVHARAIARALLELTVAYLRAYESLKEVQGVLDFDDMQIRALQLLRQSATVRRRYQRMFQYTLVDETQDIDGLQAQIIDLLSAGGSLMVVGDGQQSIYGFRYADPRVFENWQQRADADGGRIVRLQANFRSHPDILAFVAKVFGYLWHERYLTLQPMRPATVSPEELRVQVWVMPDRDPAQEARLVALQIRHWVQVQPLTVNDPERGILRPAQYGDFALLFHQFTQVEAFERAFHEAEVPYYVVGGGRGYWTRYEVRDLTNLLRALCDPEDDLALLAVLRSPFVGLSMDALTTLALHAQHAELPIRLCLQATLDLQPADQQKLEAFWAWFEPLSQHVGEWSVGTLLARALEDSQYESRLLAQGAAGRQAVANVRKLLAMALELPTVAPRAFAEQLELTSRIEQREGNAPTYEESANVVRFYTVHAAKGLEFPVVWVVDTAFRERASDALVEIDAAQGVVALQIGRPELATPYDPMPLKALREWANIREQAEAQRKLYVALTRARDYLVVMLTDIPQNAWCKGLRGALAQQLDRRAPTIPLPNGSQGLLKWLG